MSWEWSQTQEAYQNVKEQIHSQYKVWLEQTWAEIQAALPTELPGGEPEGEPEFDLDAYYLAQEEAAKLPADVLANAIGEFAQKHRLCTDGGHEAHCCPSGCHTVPFEPVTELAE